MRLVDQRLKVREIVEDIDILNDVAISILNDQLGTKKLLGRWVPHSLIRAIV